MTPYPTPRLVLRSIVGVTAIVFAFSLFVNALTLTLPLFTMQLFDRVISSHSEDSLLALTGIAVFLIVCYGFLEGLRGRMMAGIGHWISDRLRPAVTRIQFDRMAEGRPDRRGSADFHVRNLTALFGGQGLLSIFDTLWSPLFFAVAFLIHPLLGAIGLAGALGLALLSLSSEFSIRGPQKLANLLTIASGDASAGALRCAEALTAMGMAKSMLERLLTSGNQARDQQELVNQRTNVITTITRTFRYVVQIAVLAAGMWLVIDAKLPTGAVFAASMIMSRALSPFEQMQRSWKTVVSARQSYQQLTEFLAEPLAARSTISFPTPTGRLEAQAVSFALPNLKKRILHDVSFELKPGEALGIIGPSAAGKSTLARLLVGVWRPVAGQVRLDGIDVATWSHDDLGRHVGYVPQDVELLAGRIKENISRFTAADDASIIAAAQAANAHELIVRLPNGYDTEVGDSGGHLSGGQRQRIALARALFGDPQLIVLDEPNSNLDSEGEAAILDALVNAKRRGATIAIITHRPSLLGFVDKLLFLRDGKVDAFGEREAVLSKVQPRPRVVRVGAGRTLPARNGDKRLRPGVPQAPVKPVRDDEDGASVEGGRP